MLGCLPTVRRDHRVERARRVRELACPEPQRAPRCLPPGRAPRIRLRGYLVPQNSSFQFAD